MRGATEAPAYGPAHRQLRLELASQSQSEGEFLPHGGNGAQGAAAHRKDPAQMRLPSRLFGDCVPIRLLEVRTGSYASSGRSSWLGNTFFVFFVHLLFVPSLHLPRFPSLLLPWDFTPQQSVPTSAFASGSAF